MMTTRDLGLLLMATLAATLAVLLAPVVWMALAAQPVVTSGLPTPIACVIDGAPQTCVILPVAAYEHLVTVGPNPCRKERSDYGR